MRFPIVIFILLLCNNVLFAQEEEPAYPTPVGPFIVECLETDDPEGCTTDQVIGFLFSETRYPAISRENGMEGTLILGYEVNKEGKISETKVVHAFDRPSRKEGERVLTLFKDQFEWKAALYEGELAKVYFEVPMHFSLEFRGELRPLFSLEDIMCERGDTFENFRIKKRRLKKVFTPTEFAELWIYELTNEEFLSVDLIIEEKGNERTYSDLSGIYEDLISEITSLKKGAKITFWIHGFNERTFEDTFIIKEVVVE